MLFTMNVTAFAAETQENYSETEKTMTFEITPTALTSGSSRHSVGMLNSFFGTNDTVATSALGSFTISSTSVPSGSTISKIVVTSTKSSGSSGNIELFVAKDEDNGDGTFDRYTDSKSWHLLQNLCEGSTGHVYFRFHAIYDAVYHIHTCRQIILVYRFRGSTKGTEDDYERIYGVLCAS